jgi:hypothetical protein
MTHLAQWLDPDQAYDGPVDHDATDLKALAQFWTAAEAHDRAAMRSLWPQFRGLVPNQLAADIIDDIEARGTIR